MLDDIDHELEKKFGHHYTLKPGRPAKGVTRESDQDGLITLKVNFTLGLGTKLGKGYIVDYRLATFDKVTEKDEKEIEQELLAQIRKKLIVYFPNQKLQAQKENHIIKIFGDLSLGTL